jgi:hypothetical protein
LHRDLDLARAESHKHRHAREAVASEHPAAS